MDIPTGPQQQQSIANNIELDELNTAREIQINSTLRELRHNSTLQQAM